MYTIYLRDFLGSERKTSINCVYIMLKVREPVLFSFKDSFHFDVNPSCVRISTVANFDLDQYHIFFGK